MKLRGTTRHFGLATAIAIAVAGGLGTAPLVAQGPGPLDPPKPPVIVRIPTNPAAEKPPVPPEEIIRRFSAQEDEFAHAMVGYTYRKTVRLEELGENGKPTGQAEVVTEVVVADDGSRRQRPAGKPADSTLHYLGLEPDALDMLGRIAAFPLGTSQRANYTIVYQAAEPVDDLMTYVFRVTPKLLDRAHAYFSGLIWVDDHDLAIVKSYGKWVTETGNLALPDLPFDMFETYRQPVSNKYWMPAYSRADGSIDRKDGSVPVRLVILWDHFAPIAGDKSAPAPAAEQPQSSPSP